MRELAVRGFYARRQDDGLTLRRQLEGGGIGREHRSSSAGIADRLDSRAQRLRCERRKVAAPAVQGWDGPGFETEDGDAGAPAAAVDVGREAEDRLDLNSFPQGRQLLGRRRFAHPDEAGEILAEREVERDGEGCLLLLTPGERRAVALGEDGKADADEEEGGGDGGVTRVARERESGQAERNGAASGCPLQQDERRPKEPRAKNGGDEGDEAGKKHERNGRAGLRRERFLVEVAAQEREDDDGERSERRRVQGREGAPAHGKRLGPQRRQEHEGERGRDG